MVVKAKHDKVYAAIPDHLTPDTAEQIARQLNEAASIAREYSKNKVRIISYIDLPNSLWLCRNVREIEGTKRFKCEWRDLLVGGNYVASTWHPATIDSRIYKTVWEGKAS